MGKVRIYGTIGPSCKDKEILKQMFREGMDGVRLNLSHTSLEEASALIENLHSAARECAASPELLIDMQGPELRIGYMKAPVRLMESEPIDIEDIPFPAAVKRHSKKQNPDRRSFWMTANYCSKQCDLHICMESGCLLSAEDCWKAEKVWHFRDMLFGLLP